MSIIVTLFKELVDIARRVTQVSSRKERVRILAEFLESLAPEEATIAARFLADKIFLEYETKELGVGYSTLKQVYGK